MESPDQDARNDLTDTDDTAINMPFEVSNNDEDVDDTSMGDSLLQVKTRVGRRSRSADLDVLERQDCDFRALSDTVADVASEHEKEQSVHRGLRIFCSVVVTLSVLLAAIILAVGITSIVDVS